MKASAGRYVIYCYPVCMTVQPVFICVTCTAGLALN